MVGLAGFRKQNVGLFRVMLVRMFDQFLSLCVVFCSSPISVWKWDQKPGKTYKHSHLCLCSRIINDHLYLTWKTTFFYFFKSCCQERTTLLILCFIRIVQKYNRSRPNWPFVGNRTVPVALKSRCQNDLDHSPKVLFIVQMSKISYRIVWNQDIENQSCITVWQLQS